MWGRSVLHVARYGPKLRAMTAPLVLLGPRLDKTIAALPARHKLSEYAPKAKVVYIPFCR